MVKIHELHMVKIPDMQEDHTSPVFCSSMVLVHNVHFHKQDPERQVI